MLLDTADIKSVGSINTAQINVLCATWHAANVHYFKYNVAGISIIVINIIPFVPLCLICGYATSVRCLRCGVSQS